MLAAVGLNVMMKVMVESNIFTRYSVQSLNSTVISHFQFADDPLLLGVKSWASIRTLRAVFLFFLR